jgi:hypothetical protein
MRELLRRRLRANFHRFRWIFEITFVSLSISVAVAQATGQAWLRMPLYLLIWSVGISVAATLRRRRDSAQPVMPARNIQELISLAEEVATNYPPRFPALLQWLWVLFVVGLFVGSGWLCKALSLPIALALEVAPIIFAIYLAVLETFDPARPEYGILLDSRDHPEVASSIIEALKSRGGPLPVYEDDGLLLVGPVAAGDDHRTVGLSAEEYAAMGGRMIPWPFPNLK